MRARRAAAAAVGAALAICGAREAGAQAAAPFACRDVLVRADKDFLSGVGGQRLIEMLASQKLVGVTSEADADLIVEVSVVHGFSGSQIVAGINQYSFSGPETLTLSATIREPDGLGTPVKETYTLNRAGYIGPLVGRPQALARHGAGFVSSHLAPALAAYRGAHDAGARITAEAGVTLDIGGRTGIPLVDGQHVVRCRKRDAELKVGARRGGEVQWKTLALGAEDKTYSVLFGAAAAAATSSPTPLPSAPTTSTTTSVSTGAGGSGGGGDPGPVQVPWWVFLLVGGVAAGAGGAWVFSGRGRDGPAVSTGGEARSDPARVEGTPQTVSEPTSPTADTAAAARTRLKVLFLASNPMETDRLKLDEEIREVKKKLEKGEHGSEIDFEPCLAPLFDDILDALNRHKPQIVHFSGHGRADGALVIQDKDGKARPLLPELAVKLFRAFTQPEDRIRVVLLNACFSATLAKELSKVVDCTIGSTREILDDVAIAFAGGFYGAIAYGRSVQGAYDQGLLRAENEMVSGGASREVSAPDMGPVSRPKSALSIVSKEGVDPAKVYLVGQRAVSGSRGAAP